MASTTTQLQEMGVFLIRSLDGSKKLIDKISQAQDGGEIQYKDGQKVPLRVSHNLSAQLFCNGFVVVRNTRENAQVLIEHWQEALAFEKLVVLFIDEKSGNKWLLRPHIHEKIAEPKTLAQGLMTLYEHSMGKN